MLGEDRVRQDRDALESRLARSELAAHRRKSRCRWQIGNLMIDDQWLIFICAGSWRAQGCEGQILQQAIGYNRQALFSQLRGDRTEQDLTYLGSLGFELLRRAGYGQQVQDSLNRSFYLFAFWQNVARHRS